MSPRTVEAQTLADRCDALEKQIAETAAVIHGLQAKTETARSAEDLQKLQSQIDFSEIRRRSLINERIEADRSLRQQRLDDLMASQGPDPMADLLAERKQIEIRQDEVMQQIRMWDITRSRFARSAQTMGNELKRFDKDVAPALRARLESL